MISQEPALFVKCENHVVTSAALMISGDRNLTVDQLDVDNCNGTYFSLVEYTT